MSALDYRSKQKGRQAMELYAVGYSAYKRNGDGMGGGIRHVRAGSAHGAAVAVIADVRAMFGKQTRVETRDYGIVNLHVRA